MSVLDPSTLKHLEDFRAGLSALPNVRIQQGDLARVTQGELGGPFDVVYSIGVLQHTHDPDRSFANLVGLLHPGGKLVVWVYSQEGNAVARFSGNTDLLVTIVIFLGFGWLLYRLARSFMKAS